MSVYTSGSHSFGLGRLPNNDPRSRAFLAPVPDRTTVRSLAHTHYGPVLDQGQLGDCVPNAGNQALNTAPFHKSQPRLWTEPDAINDYVAVTLVDPFPGNYKKDGTGEDTGTDGTSLGNYYRSIRKIKGFSHAFDGDHLKAALMTRPAIIGLPWLENMFNPAPNGLLDTSGAVAGGHEIVALGVSLKFASYVILNSWSSSWGVGGKAYLPFRFFDGLLSTGDGDAIFFEV